MRKNSLVVELKQNLSSLISNAFLPYALNIKKKIYSSAILYQL